MLISIKLCIHDSYKIESISMKCYIKRVKPENLKKVNTADTAANTGKVI